MEIVRRSTAIHFAILICLLYKITIIQGHGRFIQPPSRASMWRFGFPTPPDYNDNEGFCGGLQKMIELGGCGICGDALNIDSPRPHEAGGKYGRGVIVNEYVEGSVIPITVQITANHRGYMTFRICPNNNINQDPDQNCFDQHVLKVYPSMTDLYVLPDRKARDFKLKLKLPLGLTCSQCIIQWTYTAGNNWGTCEDGSQGLGCGIQETFRACSDVSIVSKDGSKMTLPTSSSKNPDQTTKIPTSAKPETTQPRETTTEGSTPTDLTTEPSIVPTTSIPESGKCSAVGVWVRVPGMNEWCQMVCKGSVPFCPESHCSCV